MENPNLLLHWAFFCLIAKSKKNCHHEVRRGKKQKQSVSRVVIKTVQPDFINHLIWRKTESERIRKDQATKPNTAIFLQSNDKVGESKF